ncbi:MAG: T9SS type A sorting domain-containing protein [Candidatus Marinimicrobia bacterium]|nr:T9SS type A sorting domain-containing protein [Candidatus Neomarinimicrobiota bacterium]MCF7830048.1 T9SS type A sorting domain-containing protein [Candidatus Neomarinimicrobiota bacterium]MCF7881912.1 T9SS type A sorting domain-containing protein [Candidatus Neomarinimicrobiota bacterium]
MTFRVLVITLCLILSGTASGQFFTRDWKVDYLVHDIIDIDQDNVPELVNIRNDTTFFYNSKNYNLEWELPGKRLYPSDVNAASALFKNPRLYYPYRDYNRDGNTDVLIWQKNVFQIVDVIHNSVIFSHTEAPGVRIIPFLANMGTGSMKLFINAIGGDTLRKTYIYSTDIPTPGDSSLVGGLPPYFKLYQNYPNPFNASTVIKYKIGQMGHVKLNIYNVHGELIDVLLDTRQNSGQYTIPWDAAGLSSGTYFYQIVMDGRPIDGKKAIYLK